MDFNTPRKESAHTAGTFRIYIYRRNYGPVGIRLDVQMVVLTSLMAFHYGDISFPMQYFFKASSIVFFNGSQS